MLESDQMVTSMWASMSSWFTPTYLFCFLNLMIATIYIASNFRNHHHHHPPQPDQLARAPSLLNRVKSISFPFYSSDHHYPFAPQSHIEQPSQLARSPSLLERVKSINYSFYGQENHYPFVSEPQYEEPITETNSFSSSREEEHHSRPSQLVRAPSLLERVRSFNFSLSNHPDTFQNQTPAPHPQPDSGSHHRVTTARSKSSEKSGVIPAKVSAKVSAKMKKSASAKGVRPAQEAVDEEIERRRPATVRERKSKKGPSAETGEEGCVNAKADDFINKFKQQLKLQRLDSMLRYKEMLGRGT